jgi:hypothetical protein
MIYVETRDLRRGPPHAVVVTNSREPTGTTLGGHACLSNHHPVVSI